MMGESHFILGGVATYAVLRYTGHTPGTEGFVDFALAVGLGALVGLLPDIDSPNTMIRQIFGVGRRQARSNLRRSNNPISLLFNLVRLVLAWILDILAWFLPHRGPTHWLIVAIALAAGVYWLSWWYYWPNTVWLAFVTGYVSHLFADSITRRGIKLFAPFYNKSVRLPFRFLRVKTGSWQEGLALTILVVPLIVWLWFW